MAITSSAAALLHVALQDIHAGKAAQGERLPALCDHVGDLALAALIEAEATANDAQADRLATAIDADGPDNLWIAGILDDAERDTRQTQPGRLLDVALIGAIRKAKAAEIVSYDTTVALARDVGDADLLALATAQRAEAIEADRALKARLDALTGATAA